jgi:diguanylate cyclase (GGDEF)-like protein/PAS domain S-box-containing protein
MEAGTTASGDSRRLRAVMGAVRGLLPSGNTLPRGIWLRRHRSLLMLLWALSAGLSAYALARGYGLLHSLFEGGIVASFGVAAVYTNDNPRLASTFVSVGLMSASGVLVHISGGMIEAHFLFFVLILLLTLYEDWVPFLIAAGYVLVHHGIMGTLDPSSVYNHPDAIAHPWRWAGVHALFITGAGLAGVTAWRLNEEYRDETQQALTRAQQSKRSLAEAQQLASIGSFEWDLQNDTVIWSDELFRVFGADPQSFRPTLDSYLAGVHPEDRERVETSVQTALQTGSAFSHQYRYVRPDGAHRTFHARGEVVAAENGRPAKLVGTCQDITERERAEAQATQRAEAQAAVAKLGAKALEGVELTALLREAVASVAEVVAVDVAAVVECSTDGFRVRAGVGPGADLVGTHVPGGTNSQAGFTIAADRPVIVHDWRDEDRFDKPAVLRQANVRSGATVVIRGGNGPFGVLGIQSIEPREFDVDDINFLQSVAHVLATAIERRGIEEEIRHEAVHDPLTGLPNRNLFIDRLAQALAHARRRESAVAVLFLDIDQFKLVNDSLGHEAGDELLRAVAPRISASLRAGDTVARFGGDEFGILVDDLDGERDATRAAERVAAALSRPFVLRGREHFVTVSIGIAIADGTEEPAALIRDADSAMYRAKDRGRGRYEIFDEVMRASVVEHLEIENDLRVALEREQLLVHYQPVVSLKTNGIQSVEALLRWDHPQRGLMPPGQFISLAEESGLIVPVGAWVLEEACRQAALWHSQRPDEAPIGISVNLSARQIADPGLLTTIERILRTTRVDPLSLRLEVTETALVEEGESSLSTLQRLKSLGIGLVLDDFGTGFSSLSYLKRFPFDALKIDRLFIERLCEEPADAAIVKAVTGIADALGLEVVAEGVETREQLEAVQALGCHYAQGFHFARPLPDRELAALLDSELGAPAGVLKT